ncbi:MAG TPA: hypothetical protein VFA70_11780, partial [Dehalococcoidia bacterium]|nr:hypothetical protein [Dehalococcoidia bacterium]
AQGFAAVDMESGPLLHRQPHGAVVRVVVDSPAQELSPHWERPLRVLARPWLWPEAARLALAAPRYARLAAAVVAALPDVAA